MSLAEQIAALSNPVPVLQDPEDDQNIDTSAKVVDFDQDAEYGLDVDRKCDRERNSTLRARTSALLDEGDVRYAGKKTSRKILKKKQTEPDIYSDDDKYVQEEDHLQQDDDDDGSDVDMEALKHFKKRMARKSDNQLSKGSYSDDSEASEETEEDSDNIEELKEVDKTEDVAGTTMKTFSATAHLKEDAKKGRAIKRQLALWDALLQCRIQMQKAMVAANQLPRQDIWSTFREKGGQNFDDVVKTSHEKVLSLLDSLVDLQTSMLADNPETRTVLGLDSTKTTKPSQAPSDEEIPSDTENEDEPGDDGQKNLKEMVDWSIKKRKLTADEYPEFLHKRHCDFQGFRDATIQKWNERTKLTAGKMNSFEKFETSTLKQIEHILYDKARLIRRTQMKRSSYVVLGKNTEEEISEESESKLETQENETTVKPRADVGSSQQDNIDVEIFDDNDFYHQILRELIERKTTDVGDSVALGKQWLQIQKLRSKMKKKVDTKASKGRKIRYDVHAKLVNFMAPIDTNTLSDEAKNELFNSLFGRNQRMQ